MASKKNFVNYLYNLPFAVKPDETGLYKGAKQNESFFNNTVESYKSLFQSCSSKNVGVVLNPSSSPESSSPKSNALKPLTMVFPTMEEKKKIKLESIKRETGTSGSCLNDDNYKNLQIDGDYDTPLHIFIAKGSSDSLDEANNSASADFLLMRENYFKPYINIPDKYQQTPLHIAVFLKNVHLVFALLQLGANWCYYDCRLETPLHAAVSLANGKQEESAIFNSNKACNIQSTDEDEAYLSFPTNPEENVIKSTNEIKDPALVMTRVLLSFKNEKTLTYIDAKNDKGQAAMHIAVEKERYDIVELLKSKGADINVQENKSGYTPLMLLIRKLIYLKKLKEQQRMVQSIKRFILELKPDLNIASYSRDTALHLACMVNSEELVKCLLDAGANVNEKNMCRKSEKDLATNMQIKTLLERQFRKKRRQRKRDSGAQDDTHGRLFIDED